ncbi:peptidoglycan-binding protein [Pseudoroseomonas rhizosphaerae]|uniref:Peptidoglycan-binding protein n=1 Tax=Teichococcus rhizosphaerae TaxID=1335062 RepID=A0A2C7AHE5_9PROT|nr:LysM peptidoglycan-binding domain-containing protein [Pseudoroseomonas rhizosphaerae]PHK96147.1 peptidoglycan-binding protein [Pseudoroseomonas rhizosphaerae]
MTDRTRLSPPTRPSLPARLSLLGVAGVAASGGLAWWLAHSLPGLWPTHAPARDAPARLAPEWPSSAPMPPARGAALPLAAADMPPRFDIVRIGARGTAVVAGRAAPGAEVVLMRENGRELGRVRADARGEWVILPAEPLPPGPHELSLTARLGQDPPRRGDEALLVLVPAPEPGQENPEAEGPLAVLLPSGGKAAPRLLQARAAAGRPTAPAAGPALALDVVDYDEDGALRFAGRAPAGSHLRLYIDQGHAGDARADTEGRWALRPEREAAPGLHMLRLDQLDARGGVAARLELPFQRDRAAPAEGRVVVQPGHNLWRIARATYGRGTRYTTIYRANQEQIRDPGRIYPGQVFTLPPP